MYKYRVSMIQFLVLIGVRLTLLSNCKSPPIFVVLTKIEHVICWVRKAV